MKTMFRSLWGLCRKPGGNEILNICTPRIKRLNTQVCHLKAQKSTCGVTQNMCILHVGYTPFVRLRCTGSLFLRVMTMQQVLTHTRAFLDGFLVCSLRLDMPYTSKQILRLLAPLTRMFDQTGPQTHSVAAIQVNLATGKCTRSKGYGLNISIYH